MAAGRLTKYNDVRCASIVAKLRDGNTRKCAAEASGITYETFRAWIIDPKHSAFSADVTRAEAEAEAGAVKSIKIAIDPHEVTETKTVTRQVEGVSVSETTITTRTEHDPRMAVELLKRRWRHSWGDNINLTGMTPEQLAALAGITNE